MRRNKFREVDWTDENWQQRMKEHYEYRQHNKVYFGIAIALIGLLWLLKIIFHIPINWLTEWPFALIIIGVLIGIKNGFRTSAWWILIVIGGANIVDDYYPQYNQYLWPFILVVIGLAIAFRPKRTCKPNYKVNNSITAESNLNIDVTFGGRKEMVTAKDFKSGNISVTFGGCELNFMQADLEDSAILDLRVSFGGVEIIVPSNWHIQNEINPSFGNVEDERSMQPPVSGIEKQKTLILRGSCAFGSVEIKSY